MNKKTTSKEENKENLKPKTSSIKKKNTKPQKGFKLKVPESTQFKDVLNGFLGVDLKKG